MEVTHTESSGALRIVIDLTADDVTALKHDLPGVQGIVDWYANGPTKQKINACAERLDSQWRPKLDADPAVTSIPADRGARIAMIVARPDYKDREAREAEAEAERIAQAAAKAAEE